MRAPLQQSDSVGLVVISEEDTRTLLIHRISREDIYQRQGGGCLHISAPADACFPFCSHSIHQPLQ